MPRALIALGSNLGDRVAHVLAALAALDAHGGLDLDDVSPFMEFAAEAVGGVALAEAGGPYVNAAATLTTALSPGDLLEVLHEVERRGGRDRRTQAHGAARVIDLDLILYDDLVMRTPDLTIPHPSMHQRRFVLAPARTIAGDWVVPTMGGRTISALLHALGGGS